jgi:hypothetical protein
MVDRSAMVNQLVGKRSDAGTVSPSPFAVLRLITSSNVAGWAA